MILTFDEPQKLTDYFDIQTDTSPWNMQYKAVKKNEVPDRQQIFQVNNALKFKSNVSFPSEYGLFILAMDTPQKSIFIGYAAEDSRMPEGIPKRLKKYRSHITASNLGNGVHHPKNWQNFTKVRFNYFHTLGIKNDCSDVRFVIGKINDVKQNKKSLRYFVEVIRNNSNGILDEICSRLWNESNSKSVEILNDDVKKHDSKSKVVLWSKEI